MKDEEKTKEQLIEEIKTLQMMIKKLDDELESERKGLDKALQQSSEKLQRGMKDVMLAMASLVEIRNPLMTGHHERVANLVFAIATEMGLSEEQTTGAFLAGLVHDIGEIKIPLDILIKPYRVSEEEFTFIKTHPQVGYDLLKTIELPWPVAEIVLQHHERIDGSGYPKGLKGEAILLEARILGIADVVEAMSSFRIYRRSSGIQRAMEEITKKKGDLYDTEVVDTCLKIFTEQGFTFD